MRTNSPATSAVARIVTKPDRAALDRGAADGHSDNRGLSAAALSASINASGCGERSAQRTLRFRVLGLWFLSGRARPKTSGKHLVRHPHYLCFAFAQQVDLEWCQHPGSGRSSQLPIECGERRGSRRRCAANIQSLWHVVLAFHRDPPTVGLSGKLDRGGDVGTLDRLEIGGDGSEQTQSEMAPVSDTKGAPHRLGEAQSDGESAIHRRGGTLAPGADEVAKSHPVQVP